MARRKTQRKRRNGGGSRWWLWALLLLAAALVVWRIGGPDAEPQPKVTAQDADYRAVTDNVQKRIDEALTRAGHQVARGASVEKEAAREATGGRIRWTVSEMTVTTDHPIRWPLLLQTATPTDGVLTVSEGTADERDGAAVTRYDITLNENPDGVDLQMVMARLYVREHAAADEKSQAAAAPAATVGAPAVKPHRTSHGGRGKLAIVIDDCGYDLAAQATIESLGRPFSLAVIPGLGSSTAAAEQGHADGILRRCGPRADDDPDRDERCADPPNGGRRDGRRSVYYRVQQSPRLESDFGRAGHAGGSRGSAGTASVLCGQSHGGIECRHGDSPRDGRCDECQCALFG